MSNVLEPGVILKRNCNKELYKVTEIRYNEFITMYQIFIGHIDYIHSYPNNTQYFVNSLEEMPEGFSWDRLRNSKLYKLINLEMNNVT